MSFLQRLQAGLCALSLASAAYAQKTTITIAAEDDWAPYSSMKADKSGPEGFSPDLVRAVFKLKGVDVKFEAVPYIRCLQMVKTGKAVACFNTTITEENKDEFYWHKTPIYLEELAIFALSDVPLSGLTILGLEGRTVGTTIGYTYPTEFMQNKKIKKYEANSDDHLLKMLVAKRVQFIVLVTMPAMMRIQRDPSLKSKIKQVGLIGKEQLGLNFSKVHPDGKRMAEVFEAGLLEFKASGGYEKMVTEFKQRIGVPR